MAHDISEDDPEFYDTLTDEELMARVNRSRAISRGEEQMQLVRGLAMLQPGGGGNGRDWTDEQKMMGFMNVFHPEIAPQSLLETRQFMGKDN